MAEPKQPQSTVPVPDPTLLTTQQLTREIEGVRDLLQASNRSLRELMESRLASIDKQLELRETFREEKFKGIEKQFEERDKRAEQASLSNKQAVDAALDSAREIVTEQNRSSTTATTKSEATTLKQIEQLGIMLQTATKALDDKIGDLKDRMTRIEGRSEGNVESSDNTKWVVGAGIAIAGVIVSFALLFNRPQPLGPAYVAPPAYYQQSAPQLVPSVPPASVVPPNSR
jgi:hypothetical protein